MKILFVCKYNRFRSRVAEFLFNKYNRSKNNSAKSVGLIKGAYPLDRQEVTTAAKVGIILKGRPSGISTELLKWQDAIVIVADDVPKSVFKENEKYGKRLIVWKIPDTKSDKEQEIIRIIKMIDNKIKELVAQK